MTLRWVSSANKGWGGFNGEMIMSTPNQLGEVKVILMDI